MATPVGRVDISPPVHARAPESSLSFLREFWAGATGGTTFSWVGAAIVAFLELVTCAVVFKPRMLMKMDVHYLMESRADEDILLTQTLLRLRYAKLTGLHVAYLGPSEATRALTTRDSEKLSARLSRTAGMHVTFHALSTNNQRFEDALVITDQLPSSFKGCVVLMVNDFKDDFRGAWHKPVNLKSARERIASIASPTVAPIWSATGYHPLHTGNFFLDHLSFFAARRVAAVRFSPVIGNPGMGGIDQDKLEQGIEKFAEQAKAISEDGPNKAKTALEGRAPLLTKSRKILVRLLVSMSGRGIPLIFVEQPDFPSRNRVFGPRIERFHEELAELGEQYGAEVWDFNDELDLQDSDFQDTVHLGTFRARLKYETAFFKHLGAFMRERFGDDPDAGAGGGDVVEREEDFQGGAPAAEQP